MARVSILQLDTRFFRVPGDVGCTDTYLTNPEIIRVPHAGVANIVTDQPECVDIDPFLEAIEKANGDIIVTSCGFLSPFQEHLQQATSKPVIASVLNALDNFDVAVDPERVSVLTFDADRLGDAHFPLPYHADDFRIVGLRADNPLRVRIENDVPDRFDTLDMEAAIISDYDRALAKSTEMVILECTNLPPYKPQMRRHRDVQIVDILSAIEHIAPHSIVPKFL